MTATSSRRSLSSPCRTGLQARSSSAGALRERAWRPVLVANILLVMPARSGRRKMVGQTFLSAGFSKGVRAIDCGPMADRNVCPTLKNSTIPSIDKTKISSRRALSSSPLVTQATTVATWTSPLRKVPPPTAHCPLPTATPESDPATPRARASHSRPPPRSRAIPPVRVSDGGGRRSFPRSSLS